MSIWDRKQKIVNEGEEFRPGDTSLPAINDVTNNSLYAVDLANGITASPIVTNPDPEAEPKVEFESYDATIEGVQKTLKKFKFTNIKGQRGEKGEKGDKGDSAVSFRVGSVVTLPAGSDATATNIGTNQDVVLDLGIPKGDKGDTPVLEFDTEPRKNSDKLLKSGAIFEALENLLYSLKNIDLSYADYVQNNYSPVGYLFGLYYIVVRFENGDLCDLGIRFLGYSAGYSNRYPRIPFSYYLVSGTGASATSTLHHGVAYYADHDLTIPGGSAMLLFDNNNTMFENYTVYYFDIRKFRG